MKNKLEQRLSVESIEESDIKLMIVGFGANTLVDQVVGEPTGILLLELVSHLLELGVEIGGSQIVDDEQNFV